ALYHISDCTLENVVRCTRSFDHVVANFEQRKDQIDMIYIAFRGLENPESVAAKLVLQMLSRFESQGVRIVVQGPSPTHDYDPLTCLSILKPCAPTQALPIDVSALEKSEQRFKSLFPSRPGLQIWSPYKELCTNGKCAVRINGA